MIKNTLYILILLCLVSCGKEDPSAMIKNLDGYWEIKSVLLPDGTKKEYTISTVVDYIEVDSMSGFRKKVQPKLDGSFVVTNSEENFEIELVDEKLVLNYNTPFDSWTETILTAEPDKLTVKNRDDKVYTYSRFTKFDFGKPE